MGEVLMFPQKEQLPKGIEKRVHEIAKEYVEVLYAAFMIIGEEYDEVSKMVADAYAKGLEKAVEELETEL